MCINDVGAGFRIIKVENPLAVSLLARRQKPGRVLGHQRRSPVYAIMVRIARDMHAALMSLMDDFLHILQSAHVRIGLSESQSVEVCARRAVINGIEAQDIDAHVPQKIQLGCNRFVGGIAIRMFPVLRIFVIRDIETAGGDFNDNGVTQPVRSGIRHRTEIGSIHEALRPQVASRKEYARGT